MDKLILIAVSSVPLLLFIVLYRQGFELLRGLFITLRNALGQKITIQYPEQKPFLPLSFHGAHYLTKTESGLERCVACGLCAAVCPAKAIVVRYEDNNQTSPISTKARFASRYTVDTLRCIYCGFCEEVCPEGAVCLGQRFELATNTREGTVWKKELMLESGRG